MHKEVLQNRMLKPEGPVHQEERKANGSSDVSAVHDRSFFNDVHPLERWQQMIRIVTL